jgi:hypothetical protein
MVPACQKGFSVGDFMPAEDDPSANDGRITDYPHGNSESNTTRRQQPRRP